MFDKIKILFNYFKARYPKNFKSREDLESWQDRKVRKFLKEILKKSSFYNSKYKGLSIDSWKEFPCIDKAEMMDNFDLLNTVNIKKKDAFDVAYKAERERLFKPMIGDITVGLSSGTSGNRGIFLASKNERAKWAGTILGKLLPSSIFSKHKIAFFLRANSNLYETINSRFISFEYYDLLKSIEEHVSRLNKYNPSILVAPPSMLRLLAENDMLKISPAKIISVAEVLDKLDEDIISKRFNQKIHQVYQATEGFLATTCRCGTLHLNEDVLVIEKEFIDEKNGKFFPIITDFSRTSQPIIRYKLNDILTLKKSICPCGSLHTAIESIEGRSDDVFYLKSLNEDKYIPIFPDFISRAVIFSSELIKNYKIVQSGMENIDVYLNTEDENIKDLVLQNLELVFNKFGCVCSKISFSTYSKNSPEVKLKRVERTFKYE